MEKAETIHVRAIQCSFALVSMPRRELSLAAPTGIDAIARVA
jgi:hypothetical protein